MPPVFGDTPFPPARSIDDAELAEIGAILLSRRGFNLSGYKANCIRRRVAIRIRATRCRTTAEYCSLLRTSDREPELLQGILTIHFSRFFRNPSLFELLRSRLLPELFAAVLTRPERTLSISCLGCADGEEPYSLAILLREHFHRELEQATVRIESMDIDAPSLERARWGEYGGDRLVELDTELRQRYFRRQGERFRLRSDIREMVHFRQGNIADPGNLSPCDMLLCRNTLIYFTRPEQERILERVADTLTPGGILVLGKSETMGRASRHRFAPFSPEERIYRRIA